MGRNRSGEHELHPVAIHDAGGVDADGEPEPFGNNEQVAFAARDLLAAVVAAPAAATGRLDRLTVTTAGAGLRITSQLHAPLLAPRRVEPLPGAVEAPLAEGVKDRLPGRELVGQQAPGPAGTDDIEHHRTSR